MLVPEPQPQFYQMTSLTGEAPEDPVLHEQHPVSQLEANTIFLGDTDNRNFPNSNRREDKKAIPHTTNTSYAIDFSDTIDSCSLRALHINNSGRVHTGALPETPTPPPSSTSPATGLPFSLRTMADNLERFLCISHFTAWSLDISMPSLSAWSGYFQPRTAIRPLAFSWTTCWWSLELSMPRQWQKSCEGDRW